MALYEILITAFCIPLFYFGWMWAFRILAGVTVAKIVSKTKDQVLDSIKKKVDDNGL